MELSYKTLLDALPIGAMIIKREDPQTFSILEVNSLFLSAGVWPVNEQKSNICNYVQDVFDGAHSSGLSARFNEVLDSATPAHLEKFEKLSSITPAAVLTIDLAPLHDDAILFSYTEVTEEVMMEKARERQNRTMEYLDSILFELPIGIAILEDPDFRFLRINKKLAEINGLSVEEHLEKPLADVLSEAAGDIIPGMRKVLESGEASLEREFSTRLPRNPDEFRYFTDSFYPLSGADGVPSAVCAIVVEITEQRRLENAVLESSEREQKRLGQDIHDDVLQTLHGVWMIGERLKDELSSHNPGAAQTLQRISDLLNGALENLRMIVRGLHVVEWSPDEFRHVLKDLVTDVNRLHELAGVSCFLEVDDDVLLPDVKTATHLVRISQEAITNAIRHGAATEISVRVKQADGVTDLVICDNGIGIVQPLAKSDGLGIRIMKYRARLINGTLLINTLETGGTSVRCTCKF